MKEDNRTKMAIVFASDYKTWPMGGILNYISNIIPFLAKKYVIDFWGCTINGNEPEDIIINGDSYHIKVFGNVKTLRKIIPNYLKYYYFIYKNARLIENIGYDIIYFQGAPLTWTFMKRIKTSNSLIVNHQHGLSMPKGFIRNIQDKAFYLSDLNLINSDMDSISTLISRLSLQNKAFEQATGQVNLEKFKPSSDKQCFRLSNNIKANHVFVFTGRITAWKNPLLLIDAFEYYLSETKDDAILYIVGEGDLTKEVEEKIVKLNLKERVVLSGRKDQNEIIRILQMADVFIMLSNGEGMSLSVVEAFACGLPVIGFNVIGMKTLIKDGYNGYLLNTRTPETISQSIVKAINNLNTLSKNAYNEAFNYSAEKVSNKIINSIENELEKKDKHGKKYDQAK